MNGQAQNLCSLGEIDEKISCRLENLVTTFYKTRNNLFNVDDILVGKITMSASLTKIHFPKISGQAPLNILCRCKICT